MPPNMGGIGMGMAIGQGTGMNMGMMGGNSGFPQGMMNWGPMNPPVRSVSQNQPRPAGSQLRNSGIVDPQGGYLNDPRLPVPSPLVDRRTPLLGQARTNSPFGERERRSSFFNGNTEDDGLRRTDSRATIGPAGQSPSATRRVPVGSQSGGLALQDARGISQIHQHGEDSPTGENEFYGDHRKSSTQASTIGESQYVFDSRRGSLVGIGSGLAKRERGSGDSVFGNGSAGEPAQRPTYNRQDTVGGRLLYVANVSNREGSELGRVTDISTARQLPFNVSWQELSRQFSQLLA